MTSRRADLDPVLCCVIATNQRHRNAVLERCLPIRSPMGMRVLCGDERGATLVEYIILVGTIALVGLVGYRVFGGSVRSEAQREAECVGSLQACSGGRARSSAAPAYGSGTTSGTTSPGSTTGTATAAVTAAPQSALSTAAGWAKDAGRGFVSQGWSDVKDLGILVASATPPGAAYYALTGKPNPAAETVKSLVVLGASASTPGRIVAALGGPDPLSDAARGIKDRIASEWRRNKAETIGRGAFEVAALLIPFSKASTAVKVAATAEKAEEIGNVLQKTAEVEKAAATAAKLGEEAADAAEIEKASAAADFAGRRNGSPIIGTGSVHPPPSALWTARARAIVDAVGSGKTGIAATGADAQRFMGELYEHVREVNALMDRMAANHPELGMKLRSAEMTSAFTNVHDIDEMVPIARVKALSELPDAPAWLKQQVAAAEAHGDALMDVSKFNPDVVAGLAKQGKADPWATSLHNLSPHHSDFAPSWLHHGADVGGTPIANPNWGETVADQINAMRQPRIYRPYPLGYDQIRANIERQVTSGVLPNNVRPYIDAGIEAQKQLELEGKAVNPYYKLEGGAAAVDPKAAHVVAPKPAPRPMHHP